MEYQQKLSDLRREIDKIDEQLLYLINQRAKLAQQVGEIKRKTICLYLSQAEKKRYLKE